MKKIQKFEKIKFSYLHRARIMFFLVAVGVVFRFFVVVHSQRQLRSGRRYGFRSNRRGFRRHLRRFSLPDGIFLNFRRNFRFFRLHGRNFVFVGVGNRFRTRSASFSSQNFFDPFRLRFRRTFFRRFRRTFVGRFSFCSLLKIFSFQPKKSSQFFCASHLNEQY